MNITHRDIKPHNIVKVGSIYKLIDMDVGRSFEELIPEIPGKKKPIDTI
jgi:serine/threonine protein kinase